LARVTLPRQRHETDELLKIKVFNITKKELHKNLKRFNRDSHLLPVGRAERAARHAASGFAFLQLPADNRRR
jgi:hypothetical protein